ncbi:retrovirus-related pol polyprotein from transposon tnt 1-94 [Lasius niger]|uniref:Retrovirus-related pol polyprotein from transposon tnt 1-94 n=1 Tax=Lasius niger TaxID=67767 RepID=A0A0J7JWX7_LASNI|nr:retrovirus-related pol polyprotein from transposon tnt 1-94 [Lasius niger]
MRLSQLADISAPLDDEFIGVIMLNGLSSDFDPMVMAIESSGADITSDFVKGKLLQEDVKRSRENTSSDDGAFYARNKEKKDFKDKKRNDGPKFKKDFRCFVCNEKGHRALDCPKNTNKLNSKKSLKETEKKTDDLALLTALSAKIINKDDWYIDSGATMHMTKRKDWLTNYNPTMKKEIMCK